MSRRADIWRAIRRTKCVTANGLARATGASLSSVRPYLHALCRAGVLERACDGGGNGQRTVYVLANDVGPIAPRIRDTTKTADVQMPPRARAWQSARQLREFDVAEIQATAEVGPQVARTLTQDLLAVGYAVLARKPNRAIARKARYRLVRDTGPQPLIHARACNEITDPNTHEVFPT